MAEAKLELQTLAGYALLLLGFVMLLVNHTSIGNLPINNGTQK